MAEEKKDDPADAMRTHSDSDQEPPVTQREERDVEDVKPEPDDEETDEIGAPVSAGDD